jgi:hypothetical protein
MHLMSHDGDILVRQGIRDQLRVGAGEEISFCLFFEISVLNPSNDIGYFDDRLLIHWQEK